VCTEAPIRLLISFQGTCILIKKYLIKTPNFIKIYKNCFWIGSWSNLKLPESEKMKYYTNRKINYGKRYSEYRNCKFYDSCQKENFQWAYKFFANKLTLIFIAYYFKISRNTVRCRTYWNFRVKTRLQNILKLKTNKFLAQQLRWFFLTFHKMNHHPWL